jgi:nitroreductase
VAQQPEDQMHHEWLLYDFGQATVNMMLAAADLGIGSGHSAVSDQGQAQRVLGFPDGYRAVYLIGLGYPADRPLRPIVRQTAGRSTTSCTGSAGSRPIRRSRRPAPDLMVRTVAGR